MATNDDSITGAQRREEAQPQSEAAADMEPKSVTERVLDSAEKVLLHYGYAGFSTRRVAQEANIAATLLSVRPEKLPEQKFIQLAGESTRASNHRMSAAVLKIRGRPRIGRGGSSG